VEVSLVLEPPNPRLEFSLFLAVLSWRILGLTRKVFDEMLVKGKELK
jgi:hypothetical protein